MADTLDGLAREHENVLRENLNSPPDWPCGYERPTIEPTTKNTSANPAKNVIKTCHLVRFNDDSYTGEEAIAIGLAILACGQVALKADELAT